MAIFSELKIADFPGLCVASLTFWESFGSERRVIKEITSLALFTCPYQVFINNYPGACIPQLDAGSLIGIRSHLKIHDYIKPKKEL